MDTTESDLDAKELLNDFGPNPPFNNKSLTYPFTVPGFASNYTNPYGESDAGVIDASEYLFGQTDSSWTKTNNSITLYGVEPPCTPTPVANSKKAPRRKHSDNEEFVPDSDSQKPNPHCKNNRKQTKKRIRGHNLSPDIRFRVGQLKVGYKNKYPHKSMKDISHLIYKRLCEEYP